jgi:hypothetical protein
MNRRLIEQVLRRKFDDFTKTITDERVRKLVEKNSIITGGAIASMLLQEKVNDFDVYFTNYATCLAAAEYYVAEFIRNNPDCNVKPVIWQPGMYGSHLNVNNKSPLRDNNPHNEGRVRIVVKSAGACAEGDQDQQYQYFENCPDETAQAYVDNMLPSTQDGFQDAVAKADDTAWAGELDEGKPKYRPIFMTANAITLSHRVQLVIRFYGPPDEIHKNYDYIHCCNYWESESGKLTLNPLAIESLLSKNLLYQGSLYPICSVIRLRKFLKNGWHVNAGQILKMCFQISELDLTDLDTLDDQLTGVDAAYFFQIIDYCRKRMEADKDFKLTMPYLVSIIDKIFG